MTIVSCWIYINADQQINHEAHTDVDNRDFIVLVWLVGNRGHVGMVWLVDN